MVMQSEQAGAGEGREREKREREMMGERQKREG